MALTAVMLESGVSTAVTSALTTAATEMTGLIGYVVPIALPVVTGVLVVTFGIKVFKKIAGR